MRWFRFREDLALPVPINASYGKLKIFFSHRPVRLYRIKCPSWFWKPVPQGCAEAAWAGVKNWRDEHDKLSVFPRYLIGGKAETFDFLNFSNKALPTRSIVLVIPAVYLSCMSTLPLQTLYFKIHAIPTSIEAPLVCMKTRLFFFFLHQLLTSLPPGRSSQPRLRHQLSQHGNLDLAVLLVGDISIARS